MQNVNLGNYHEITLRGMPQNTSDDKSTLVQVNDLVPLPEPVLTQIYVAINGITRPQ